jgi:hypothetical protein
MRVTPTKSSTKKFSKAFPITIEDIFKTANTTELKKNDIRIREFSIRTEPKNEKSPIIKQKYVPLSIPSNIYEVLKAIEKIEEGIKGNNITQGENMFAYCAQCLEGEAKRQFELLKKGSSSLSAATFKKTTQQLTTYFCAKDLLVHQQSYMRYNMVKPEDKTMREFVYAAITLNNSLAQLPPLFNNSQKIPASEFLHAVHQNVAKPYRDIIKFHGFKLSDGIVKDYIEMCERANLEESDGYSSDNAYDKKKAKKKKRKNASRPDERKKKSSAKKESDDAPFYCSHHGWNDTHTTKKCYTLQNLEKKKKKSKGNKKEVMILESKLESYGNSHKEAKEELKLQKKINAKLYTRMKLLQAQLKYEKKGKGNEDANAQPSGTIGPIPRKAKKNEDDIFSLSSDDENGDEESSKESGETTDTDSDSD